MIKQFSFLTLKIVIAGLLIYCLPTQGQIDENIRVNVKKAYTALSLKDCQFSLKYCNEVLKIVPNHPVVNYLAARLNALLGNEDTALVQLKKAIKLGYTTKLPFNKIHQLNDTAFSSLRKKEKFKEIIDCLKNAEKPIHKSKLAFTLSDKTLDTEGITYDPVEKMFYLGILNKHKIVKVDHSGNIYDFTTEGQDGLNKVLGIHVDSARRLLWACSRSEEASGIFKYDLLSGILIKKYLLSGAGMLLEFNDLVIHPDGDIYITENIAGGIYKISHTADTLELFLKNNLILSPNGITLSNDGREIFVGDTNIGIYKIDITTKSISMLSCASDFGSYGTDGLYFYDNKLYAVQVSLNRISMFSLSADLTGLNKCEIFEKYTPELTDPTTGVIVEDYFYYISDAGSSGIVIMKYPLKE